MNDQKWTFLGSLLIFFALLCSDAQSAPTFKNTYKVLATVYYTELKETAYRQLFDLLILENKNMDLIYVDDVHQSPNQQASNWYYRQTNRIRLK